jgi:DNA-binding transcriptional MerR regulator
VSETGDTAPGRRANKPASAFRTIGEAADELQLPAHVLRFWESKFPQLQPMKRGGGRRYYRPEDLALLRRIRQCLYQEGYTIRGVQKLLNGTEGDGGKGGREDAPAAPTLFPLAEASAMPDGAEPPAGRGRRQLRPRLPADMKAALGEIRRELCEARTLLAELAPPRKGA